MQRRVRQRRWRRRRERRERKGRKGRRERKGESRMGRARELILAAMMSHCESILVDRGRIDSVSTLKCMDFGCSFRVRACS